MKDIWWYQLLINFGVLITNVFSIYLSRFSTILEYISEIMLVTFTVAQFIVLIMEISALGYLRNELGMLTFDLR